MSRRRMPFARIALTAAAVAAAAVTGLAVSPSTGRVVEAVGEPLGSGGEFHSLAPQRIFDTRDPSLDVVPLGRKAIQPESAGPGFDVTVVGRAGVPAFVDTDADGFDDNVLAIVANITVIAPTQLGFLRATPTGVGEGNTSVVNFDARTFVPNAAILRPGKDGKISIRLVNPTAVGAADIAIDISGWISTSQVPTRGSRMIPVNPVRLYDSDLAQFGATPVGARGQIDVPIRGAVDPVAPGAAVVPNDADVVGVVVNITGANWFPASRPTYVTALPDRLAPGVDPTTSTLNLQPGQVRANTAIMPVGADGAIHLFNLDGSVRLIVDVMGYLLDGEPADTRAGRVIPLVAPFRAFDTRAPEFFSQPLGPASAEDWSFQAFVNDVKIQGQAVGNQAGLLGNFTATNLQRQYASAPAKTFMTAYPTPTDGSTKPPVISNLNLDEGETVPNLTLLRYGGDASDPYKVRFYNLGGYVDYLLDVYAVILAD
ncbi:MAG: hypothetical protein ABIO83_09220 [Ilumatobacteraceae bacterium]